MASIVLIHGGLHEPVSAHDFWVRTGVTDALSERGIDALTPDRLTAPTAWSDDADHVVEQLTPSAGPLPLLGGSNGCSTAALIASTQPALVSRLALCWPVTAGQDHAQEGWLREHITSTHGAEVSERLLAGGVLRGVDDAALAALTIPLAVMASDPDNLVHQRETATALLELLSGASALPPMPEPPSPAFEPREFAAAVAAWLGGTPTSASAAD